MGNSFILKGNICHTPCLGSLEIREHACIVCAEGTCRGIFDNISQIPEQYGALEVIDCGDSLVLPGMVDLHIHAPQYAFRGTGMDYELLKWLDQVTFPEEIRYADTGYAARAYEIFSNGLKKGATTRAVLFATRHRPATELLMELMEQSGLVSYVGKVNMDRGATEALEEESAEISAHVTYGWINAVKDKFARTKPILTPRFIPCCTDELMEKLRDIQTKYGVAVQSHVSENLGEIEFVHQLRPNNKFYGEVYDEYNMFGLNHNNGSDVKTIMAHCIWSCDEEIEMMKKQNVFVVHCPASNTNVVAGIAPIRKYIEAGLKIGLGSDVAGGQTESMFRAITDAIQVSKLRWRLVDQGDKPLTFAESFYLATKGGGEFFGKVGSFEEGYEFDAVILDDSHCPHPQELTIAERLERAAYLSADLNGIKAKYVAGKKVF